MSGNKIKAQAPAKINLFLHVTGKREDGYHLLESLVGFCDIADVITISSSSKFNLTIDGPFASALNVEDNLIVKTVNLLAEYADKLTALNIHLTKNIPLGAGLGGGSADAAAVFKGLMNYWDIEASELELRDLLLQLGADVPVCYASSSCIMRGIGEEIESCDIPLNIPVLLIYPNVGSSTEEIFKNYDGHFSKLLKKTPTDLSHEKTFLEFLKKQNNDLTDAAGIANPLINAALDLLKIQTGTMLARMSGSGSTCFGLFSHFDQAESAKAIIKNLHPDWWVETSLINKI